jgi:hypothetical protein
VATDDIEGTAERLGLRAGLQPRSMPGGNLAPMAISGVGGGNEEPALPFLSPARCHQSKLHPAPGPAPHRVRPRDVPWVELAVLDRISGPGSAVNYRLT